MPAKGLTSAEAKNLLLEFGLNVLPERPQQSDLSIFASQLKNPLVYILLAAGTVTLFLESRADSAIIFAAVFINTVLGFVQERRAGRALAALKKLLNPAAAVLRDGARVKIRNLELVPGDVVFLNHGDKVPADGRVFESNRFYVSEAILTGESVPVEKIIDNEVFMGTAVVAGNAGMVVEKTGASTQMGRIAQDVQTIHEGTPLKKQLTALSRQLSTLVLILAAAVFLIGFLLGESPADLFAASVALAVAAIPEGLLVGLTVILAVGMQRILKRRGLVRNLVSAETLGGVTTICVDKTGTLTMGEMRVTDVVGDEREIARQVLIANDRDDPIVAASWEWGNTKVEDVQSVVEGHWRIDGIPFSSKHRMSVSLHRADDDRRTFFVTGAPEELLARSNLSEEEKEFLHQKIEQLSKEGKRLLGFARKKAPHSVNKAGYHFVNDGLVWVGLLAFSDPVRPGVKGALAKTRDAGIKLIVITGDYLNTALSVMAQLGVHIDPRHTMLGKEIEQTRVTELALRLKKMSGPALFARTTPDQKLKIVVALKLNGEVVAMTGDGVNDAPALSKADIGIVVGEASEVAKESSDLILIDSSFSTIVAAIEEGRGIFDNIRKVLLYLMSDAFQIIVAVFLTLVFRFPLPVSAAQILWINLVSDGFPDLALTIDPKRKKVMREAPRSPGEPLVADWMRWLILVISVVGGVAGFLLFAYVYKATGDESLARSAAFAVLGLNTLFYVFSIRSLIEPVWKESVFENKWLVLAVVAGFALQLAPFVFESLRGVFGVESLGIWWYWVFGISIAMFCVVEIVKWRFRRE